MNDTLRFVRELFPGNCHDHIWLVGGLVRDYLRGSTGRDIDLISTLPPAALMSAGFRPVSPTSAAPVYFLHHRTMGTVEATLLASVDDLQADLKRRDFTANAVAMTLDGTIIDPLDGRPDVRDRILRPCSARSFIADPVRIFRGFRFEAEEWRLTPDAEELIRGTEWDTPLRTIPVERFSQEMLKALAAPVPARFFERMVSLGVGRGLLPELFRMAAVPAGPPEHHPEGDLFTHATEVLTRMTHLSGDPTARFCALLHDLGKLDTEPTLWPRHHGHEERGQAAAPALCRRLRLPSAMGTALAWCCRLHGRAGKWTELRDSTRVRMAEQARHSRIAGILPLLAEADRPGRTMEGWDVAVWAASLNAADLGISDVQMESIQPADRSSLLLQRRVEQFRNRLQHTSRD